MRIAFFSIDKAQNEIQQGYAIIEHEKGAQLELNINELFLHARELVVNHSNKK